MMNCACARKLPPASGRTNGKQVANGSRVASGNRATSGNQMTNGNQAIVVPSNSKATSGNQATGGMPKKAAEQRPSDYVTAPSSYFAGRNFISQDSQNQLVHQLIDELVKNLHNKTLINRIRDLDEKNDQQLISNLTGNLENKDPLMSEYLDQRLKNYLTKVQQQSLNQTVDLMDILKQVLIFSSLFLSNCLSTC